MSKAANLYITKDKQRYLQVDKYKGAMLFLEHMAEVGVMNQTIRIMAVPEDRVSIQVGGWDSADYRACMDYINANQ